MKLAIGGARGTNPVSQPGFTEFGGETTSFLIEGEAGERLLVDAGTGIRTLAERLEQGPNEAEALVLLTHYHLDHIMGFPAFSPLYKGSWKIEVASPAHDGFRVDEVMPRIFKRPLWPLQIEHLDSHLRFRTLKGESPRHSLRLGNFDIRWCNLHHPGGSVAYRIDEATTKSSVVIATDMEWALSTAVEQRNLLEFTEGASLLLMDGQMTPDDYEAHRGWGHSTWVECCEVARRAGVGSLWITHHAPWRNDEELHRIEAEARAYWPHARLARQGAIIAIPPRAKVTASAR